MFAVVAEIMDRVFEEKRFEAPQIKFLENRFEKKFSAPFSEKSLQTATYNFERGRSTKTLAFNVFCVEFFVWLLLSMERTFAQLFAVPP